MIQSSGPLAWYTDLSMQNHRKSYSYGDIFMLVSPRQKLLPFQFIRPTKSNVIVSVKLYNIDDTEFADITQNAIETGLVIIRHEADGYDIIKYHAMLFIQASIPEGLYYLCINDGADLFYSEVFQSKYDLSKCIKLDYWEYGNFELNNAEIDYSNLYRNSVYIQSELGKPEYSFEEVGEKRDGLFFAEKSISKKVYKFTFLAPEYLLDALQVVRMHDYIQVTSMNTVYEVDSFLLTPKWLDGGYLAQVDCEFECSTVVKKISKAIPKPIPIGSFNEDYDNSFEN